jgi:hypothetical protein
VTVAVEEELALLDSENAAGKVRDQDGRSGLRTGVVGMYFL